MTTTPTTTAPVAPAAATTPPTPTKAAVPSAIATEINAVFGVVVTWVKAHSPTVLAFACGFIAGFLLR